MQGIEYVEKVFQICFSLVAVVEKKQRECKQGRQLEFRYNMRCNQHKFHQRHAQNFNGDTIHFLQSLRGRYVVKVKN